MQHVATMPYGVSSNKRVDCSAHSVLNFKVECQQVRRVCQGTGYGLVSRQEEGHTTGNYFFLCCVPFLGSFNQ